MHTKDMERTEQALGAIKLIRGHYASGPDSQRLMQEILKILRGDGSNVFCSNIADAIDAANRMKRVQEVTSTVQSAA